MPGIRALFVIGTRPEAVKLARVVAACRVRPRDVEAVVCFTGQHRELLAETASYLQLEPQFQLDAMRPGQGLASLTARCLEDLDRVLERTAPHCVVAQGDTTSVLAASLAAFYRHIPLVHVEAGLRTGDLAEPWPEEMNRRLAGLLAAVHCAPTERAVDNLLRAGADRASVHLTGNPVVDTLLWTLRRERRRAAFWQERYAMLGDRSLVLVTCHRRENHGPPLRRICAAVLELAQRFPRVEFLFPLHLNPQVQGPVRSLLSGRDNVHLAPPASYPEFVWLMDRAALLLSDSGGVQEEAPSLGKPVLVLRRATERPETIESGCAELVGTSRARIVEAASALLFDPVLEARRGPARNPFGDGQAAPRIVEAMLAHVPGAGQGHRSPAQRCQRPLRVRRKLMAPTTARLTPPAVP